MNPAFPSPPPTSAPPPRSRLPPRLQRLVDEYGKVALVVYFVLWGLAWALALAFIRLGIPLERFGFPTSGAAGAATTFGAAWAATRVTLPIRIGLTVLLTPLVARLHKHYRRIRGNL